MAVYLISPRNEDIILLQRQVAHLTMKGRLLERRAIELEAQTATFEPVDMLFVMMSAFGVFFITPAIAMFYGGTLKRKNLVQLLFQSYMVTSCVIIIWYLIGYSLANSPSSTSVMIGNVAHAALHLEEAKPLFEGGTIPSIVNFCFSAFFPVATVQIFLGGIGERGRFLPSLVVGCIWVIVCYCPMAFWVWGANGWLLNLGALDFAGGGPVHIASGVASLCYSWYLGPRGQLGKRTGRIEHYRGHSSLTTFIGVTFIWGGWFLFNAGTLLAVNVRTGYIMANTILASVFGCVTYVGVDTMLTGKFSLQAACEGVIVGLVNITPSCGYYWPWAAALTTVINAALCRCLGHFNKWTGIDDYSVSGVVHGVGGIIGDTLTGIFASATVTGFDGYSSIEGGWINGNFRQIGLQMAAWCSIVAWTTVFTLIILFIVDHIPGLKLRVSEEGEEMGMDLYEMAETCDEFGNDYAIFFEQYAHKIKHIVDNYEKYAAIELLEGEPANDSSSVADLHYVHRQKV